MDVIQDHLTTLYALTATSPTLRQTLSLLSTTTSYLTNVTKAHLLPLVANITTTKPDIASLAILLVVLLVSLKILNILLNTVLFWLRLLARLLFWAVAIALVTWVVARGPDEAVRDVQRLADVWKGEYQYWRDRADVAAAAAAGGGSGRRGEATGRWGAPAGRGTGAGRRW